MEDARVTRQHRPTREDFNGILVEAPSINQTQFFPADVWPSLVTQRDLAGVSLTAAQVDLVSRASISRLAGGCSALQEVRTFGEVASHWPKDT